MLMAAPVTSSGWRSGYRLATSRATEQGPSDRDNCSRTFRGQGEERERECVCVLLGYES